MRIFPLCTPQRWPLHCIQASAFGRARALERADLSVGWAKELTCGNCGQTHDYRGHDLVLLPN
jgi:hypothetical protein